MSSAPEKGAGGNDVPCVIDGGRLTYEDSLDAHGYQRYRLKCTFHANCSKSRNAGEIQMSRFGHMEPVGFSDSLALARSMPGDQAATCELASADRSRAAGLASGKRSHVVTTENRSTIVQGQMHHNRVASCTCDSESCLCQRP